MRTRLLRTATAMLVVLLAFEVLARTLEPHLPEPTRWGNPFTDAKAAQIEDLAADGGVDVLLAGSSIANAGLDPDAFDSAPDGARSAYNAALPGVSIRYVDAWVREIALPQLCPSLLVVGVTARDYNDRDSSNRRSLDAYREATPRLIATDQGGWLDRVDRFAVERSTFLRLRSLLRQPANVVRWLRGERVRGWPPRWLTAEGRYIGFDNDTYAVNDRRRAGLERAFRDFTVGGAEEEALERLVETAQGHGVEVAIVEMPVLEGRLTPYLPDGLADIERFRQSVEVVAARTGATLVQLPEFADREELFADEYHPNGDGTPMISAAIVRELRPLLESLPAGGCSAPEATEAG